MSASRFEIIGTCPAYTGSSNPASYLEDLRRVVRRAEASGWSSVLIYADHRQLDPWLLAQLVIQSTETLVPLIAVQPLYSHPFTIAKLIVTHAVLHGRATYLNFVSGGFPRDLEAFCDRVDHAARFRRIFEYGTIIQRLLMERKPVSFSGEFYQVTNLQLQPHPMLEGPLKPKFTMSGSSDDGIATARRLGALPIQYLRPSHMYAAADGGRDASGCRLGLIARSTSSEAWAVAEKRFPDDPIGTEMRRYYTAISDSVWVKELGREVTLPLGHPYWLRPYSTGRSSCPFLVGSFEDVAAELAAYSRTGISTFLVELPWDDEDEEAINQAFSMASASVVNQVP